VQPDPAAYRLQQDYQHASGALEKVVTSEAPYVDPTGLAAAQRDWRQFVDHAVAYGYNGVVIPENLVVSTKFTMGDFDSWLPLNPTLGVGEQVRLVEMQGRREFEAFNAIPDDMGSDHQVALQRFLAGNPHIDGLWSGPRTAGRGGPDRCRSI